jgi:hypothetical protein
MRIKNLFPVEVDKCSVATQRSMEQTNKRIFYTNLSMGHTHDISRKSFDRFGTDVLFSKVSERSLSRRV